MKKHSRQRLLTTPELLLKADRLLNQSRTAIRDLRAALEVIHHRMRAFERRQDGWNVPSLQRHHQETEVDRISRIPVGKRPVDVTQHLFSSPELEASDAGADFGGLF